MTKEQAIEVLRCNTNLGYGIVIENESTQLIKEAIEMAIKVLEQEGYYKDLNKSYERTIAKLTEAIADRQPCDDCVSRQAVLDLMQLKMGGRELYKAVYELPPVIPTQRWIPVSERLPKVGEKVLCQCQANIFEVLKLTVDGWYHDENHCYMSGFVIAWQPLPKAYKADK